MAPQELLTFEQRLDPVDRAPRHLAVSTAEAINQQLNVTGLDNAFQLFLYSTISNSDFLVFERDYTRASAGAPSRPSVPRPG